MKTMQNVMLRLRAAMIGFVIGSYTIPVVDHLARWHKVTFIDLPKITSDSPLIVVPESERNPLVLGGSGPFRPLKEFEQ